MMRTTLLLLALVATACVAASGPASKALSGPPNEFPNHEVPSASMNGISADSAAYFVYFEENSHTWKRSLRIDASQFGFSFFSPPETLASLSLTLLDPSGNAVDITGSVVPVNFPVSDDSGLNSQFTGNFYTVLNAATGDYTLIIEGSSETKIKVSGMKTDADHNIFGIIYLYNDSPDYIFTHLSDSQTIVGKHLGLGTRMYDAQLHEKNNNGSTRNAPPTAHRNMVQQAVMEILFPDGHTDKKEMHDDGLSSDGEANDGEYGATFLPTEPGQYVMQAVLQGSNNGKPFIRTTQHFVQVVPQTAQLTGKVFAALHLLEDRVALHFEVSTPSASAAAGQLYRIYGEVYGVQKKGNSATVVPVAWVSTITTIQQQRGRSVLSCEIALAWFAKASAEGPITIKNAYIQDVASMVPISSEPTVQTFTPPAVRQRVSTVVKQLLANGYAGEVTREMMEGVPPAHIAAAMANNTEKDSNGGKLVVLHGYCAAKNPFSVYPEDWTDAVFYSDPGKGIGVDEYARNVIAFVEAQGLTSFGLVGHSQGGMVSLHIMNYYHTGLDAAKGSRKIQSLASPFMGNSAAASADNMKKLFGLGCGTVNELTVDGATAWLAGISSNAIKQLNYYTTQYDKGGLFGNGWCNMVMNTQLDNPNDGATELNRARLNGAINRGHTIGQCHTDGMKWPASYFDHARNKEMSANAAR